MRERVLIVRERLCAQVLARSALAALWPFDDPQPCRLAGPDDVERRRRMSTSEPADGADGADVAASGGLPLAAAVAAAAAAARRRPAARASSGRARTTRPKIAPKAGAVGARHRPHFAPRRR